MTQGSYGKTDLIDDLTKNTSGLTRSQIASVLDTALDLIQDQVRAGNRVTITGFGTWQQTHRAARTGVNPQTKAKLQIPAQTSVNFRPGTTFKQAVSSGKASYARERAAGSGRK